MDRGWADFWSTLWHVVGTFFFTIVWPIAITIYMFAFTNIVKIGGTWGLIGGGFVMMLVGNSLTGSAAGYFGQANSSGFVNLIPAGSRGDSKVLAPARCVLIRCC